MTALLVIPIIFIIIILIIYFKSKRNKRRRIQRNLDRVYMDSIQKECNYNKR
jgi:hypothetical protein